jgi:hypothetical protein
MYQQYYILEVRSAIQSLQYFKSPIPKVLVMFIVPDIILAGSIQRETILGSAERHKR